MTKAERTRAQRARSLARLAIAPIVFATMLAMVATPSGDRAFGATKAPASAPAPPGCTTAAPLFSDTFSGRDLGASWNPYVTSRAANGYPWDSNGSGGSSIANPAQYFNADYDLPDLVKVDDGLAITARKEPVAGVLGRSALTYPWRSGVVSSYGHFQFDGGCITVDAKIPSGAGMWPGLWLLPGPGSTSGDNFEIDLFEGGMLGASPAHAFAWHLHTATQVFGGTSRVGADLFTGYHRYSLRWIPGRELVWYLDGTEVGSLNSSQAPIPNEPMELIMDLAVANPTAAAWHTLVGPSTPATDVLHIRSIAVYPS